MLMKMLNIIVVAVLAAVLKENTIATASRFTKVSIIQSWSLEEAEVMLKFLEQAHPAHLDDKGQIHLVAVYQSLKKAMDNG